MGDDDLTFFQSSPWCASLINDPSYVTIPTSSRESKESTEDALFGDILKTDKTISACLSLYKKPAASTASIEEVTTLLSLESGLNGYRHVCHGGIVATILDEVMGILLSVNKDREAEIARATGKSVEEMAEVTAELTVKYLKPVSTPQTVRVKVSFSRTEGRKFWMEGTIEDKSGTVLARGEALFIRIRKSVL
jgi:acyl-coenzyme A thioesterase PaaI-like protein